MSQSVSTSDYDFKEFYEVKIFLHVLKKYECLVLRKCELFLCFGFKMNISFCNKAFDWVAEVDQKLTTNITTISIKCIISQESYELCQWGGAR